MDSEIKNAKSKYYNNIFSENKNNPKKMWNIVTPLFKNGSPHDLNNYRPVSKIGNISKIFEKAILNQLFKFFDQKNLFFVISLVLGNVIIL